MIPHQTAKINFRLLSTSMPLFSIPTNIQLCRHLLQTFDTILAQNFPFFSANDELHFFFLRVKITNQE